MHNVLVADDERIARKIVTNLLASQSDIGPILEAKDGNEALALAQQHQPDIVFLDIQMPGQTGVQLADKLPYHCALVFVTAYDEYAVEAFELCAVDYLLKPFDDARFFAALDKARHHLDNSAGFDRDKMAQFFAYIQTEQQSQHRSRLVIKEPGRIRLLNVEDINYIAGAGNYVELHLLDGTQVLHRETLTRLESQLDPSEFVRIHRSTIVRQSSIKELRPGSKGDYEITLSGGDKVTLSRRNRNRLSAYLD
ncbi:LytR/AlgR family response regulator transcription factor [Alteromonas halophila]|uniref:DNA-binding response regulator n=1 Tax=Alteromonas halophila TaxID=516698 RepID=A0A918MWS1_9ALTE|nr:LytTR family DNA-binding domain-containing protein [Alteromonas halophila]GGW79575.1 DNA-binding response regulator [Alteromonas halophila]